MLGDEARTALALVAIVVSLAGMFWSYVLWKKSNRPTVTAFLLDNPGSVASTYDLVVSNSGNRPALEVRLRASRDELAKLVRPGHGPDDIPGLIASFTEPSIISVLRNGEELLTSLGVIRQEGAGPSLQYNSRVLVEVSYGDLDGRKYRHAIPLIVRAREGGFGGGRWRRVSSPKESN